VHKSKPNESKAFTLSGQALNQACTEIPARPIAKMGLVPPADLELATVLTPGV